MKIALANPYFYPSIGGVEKYFKKIADEYQKLGHQVAVFTCDPNCQTPINKQTLAYPVIFSKGKKFLKYHLPSAQNISDIKKFNPDIIHVNSPIPYASMIGLKMGKRWPVVSTYHADANPKIPPLKLAAKLEKTLYKKIFKRLIVTTPFFKNRAAKFYPESRINVVPLGLDEVFLNNTKSLSEKCSSVLFVGALDQNHYYKGVDVLLKTAQSMPKFSFLIVGDGDKKNYYENLVKKLNLQNVKFLGNLEQQQLIETYQNAAILILPSTSSSEGFGLVLLEAMACGTPVITTNCIGSAEEIAANHCGLIIEPNSPEALKQAIQKISTTTELSKKFIENGLKYTAKLSWQNTAEQTLKVYEQAIKQN